MRRLLHSITMEGSKDERDEAEKGGRETERKAR